MLNRNVLLGFFACVLLAAGIGLGYWLAGHFQLQFPPKPASVLQTDSKPHNTEPTVLYWYDPMMPQQHFDKPGKSPYMDMELLPKYAETRPDNASLKIDPLLSENIGVRLASVTRIPISHEITVSGLVRFNDRDVAIVQTRSSGFVERVWPLAAGDLVKAGQPLAEILQPEWAAAQQELLAVKNLDDHALLIAARERLHLLGMPENLIRQLEHSGVVQSRITISSPINGVIQSLEVRNGMSLMNAQTLARINGLSSVWLEAAIPEILGDSLAIGNTAKISFAAYPGQSFQGHIAVILPELNETSRSIRVRIELNNPGQQLRPGMTAQITLNTADKGMGLAIPTEAVIRTGKRSLVILAGEAGRYTPQEISIAHEIGDKTLVSAGLEEGQQIVASGQFLIDSEASLNGIEAQTTAPGHQHEATP